MITRPVRLGYLVSHPIQYHAPLLRLIGRQPDIEFRVLFCSDLSVREYEDPEFGTSVQWDVPLVDGYHHEFLPGIGGSTSLGFWCPFNYGIAAAIKRYRFDALWIHGWGYFSHLWAIRVARLFGVRVLMRGESSLHLPPHGALKQALKDRFVCNIVRNVDAFLSIGSLNREFYQHYGAPSERIFSMPYAVDNGFFKDRCALAHAERRQLRKQLELEPGRPVILYASKLTERKRITDLVEAYVRLSVDGRSEPDPYLLVVGDGEMRAALERRIQQLGWGSIRYLGFKNQTELPAFFDLCDVFVLPSFNEPWGLVVNEVMNAGRAVVVTDQVGCAPDLVRNGESGVVYKAGDVDALSRALSTVLDHPERTRSMGAASRNVIDQWGLEADLVGLRQALVYLGLLNS